LKRKSKYFLVKENATGRLYGAFPHTEEGEKQAKKYVRKIGGKKMFSIESK
tara:strand:+ start:284 stop:436 length:153 start_codon:yes stop_codon:yes gene_type:complete